MKITIAQDIRQVRKALGLSQRAFAQLFNRRAPIGLKTHSRNISKYETGKMACPTDKYLKFMSLKPKE